MSSNGKSIGRIQSAPPDEGEPHLKISYNPNATEFKPPAASSKTAQAKKELNASASDYVPHPPPAPTPTPIPAQNIPFIPYKHSNYVYPPYATNPKPPSLPLKSFAFNPSVIEFSPGDFMVKTDKKVETNQEKEVNTEEKRVENNSEFVKTEKTEPVGDKAEVQAAEEITKKEPLGQNPDTENTRTDENTDSIPGSTEEPEVQPVSDPTQAPPASSSPGLLTIEPAAQPRKKHVYDLESIKVLKFSFIKDPAFLVLPSKILQIKDREVEETKQSKGNRRNQDDRRVSKELVRKVVVWRKAKTAEEQKISERAKEYQRKFTATIAEQERIKKEVKSTLNKLSPNNLAKLTSSILDTCKKSHDCLKLVVSGIFEKAWSEKKYTQMYSDMCKTLKVQFQDYRYPDTDPSKLPKTNNYFKYELLYMCEETFSSSHQDEDLTNLPEDQKAEKLKRIKDKTLGNVRFIGELFNVNLITTNTILECVVGLLDLFERENNQDKLEGACLLLSTGGASFERSKLLESTNKIYERLEKITQMEISSKNKFKIMDLKEFRQAGWSNGQREGLKKVEEIHADFMMEQEEIKRRHGYNN